MGRMPNGGSRKGKQPGPRWHMICQKQAVGRLTIRLVNTVGKERELHWSQAVIQRTSQNCTCMSSISACGTSQPLLEMLNEGFISCAASRLRPGSTHGSNGDLNGGAFALSPAEVAALRQGHPLYRCLSVLNHVMQHPAAAPFCSQVSIALVTYSMCIASQVCATPLHASQGSINILLYMPVLSCYGHEPIQFSLHITAPAECS